MTRFEAELFSYVYWSQRRAVNFWKSLSGLAFERELATVFRLVGYEATVTHASGDQGVDIVIRRDGKTGIVQCKARKGPVGPNVVRELLGSAVHFNPQFSVIASASGFTPAAIEFAEQKGIELLNISDIIKMQEECGRELAHFHVGYLLRSLLKRGVLTVIMPMMAPRAKN